VLEAIYFEHPIWIPGDGSYTTGMKTAISLPDRVFREAEKHARRAGKSRSQLYADAVSEYLVRHAPEAVTEAMNDVCDRLGQPDGGFMKAATRRQLRKEAW
jgi:antitoxin MazE6